MAAVVSVKACVAYQMPDGRKITHVPSDPDEFASVKPVDEQTQAAHYDKAIRLAYCQKTVIGILLFHVFDEVDLRGWQSGTRYVDDTPKASYEPVKRTAEAARRDDVDCDSGG